MPAGDARNLLAEGVVRNRCLYPVDLPGACDLFTQSSLATLDVTTARVTETLDYCGTFPLMTYKRDHPFEFSVLSLDLSTAPFLIAAGPKMDVQPFLTDSTDYRVDADRDLLVCEVPHGVSLVVVFRGTALENFLRYVGLSGALLWVVPFLVGPETSPSGALGACITIVLHGDRLFLDTWYGGRGKVQSRLPAVPRCQRWRRC